MQSDVFLALPLFFLLSAQNLVLTALPVSHILSCFKGVWFLYTRIECRLACVQRLEAVSKLLQHVTLSSVSGSSMCLPSRISLISIQCTALCFVQIYRSCIDIVAQNTVSSTEA